ncbi:hypothetical protein [Propionispira arboris]|uniref:hypothetical protein n=1 Tax=Propionispira arboris TaxID=84035 RepID=UPI001C42E784
MTQYNNIKEARTAIVNYIHTYNFDRCHSAINYQKRQNATIRQCCWIMWLDVLYIRDSTVRLDSINISVH